jgi:hypothetical protein
MSIRFTPELGAELLEKIQSKRWKVVYEDRNHGDLDQFQPIEEIFKQVAETLSNEPRYRIYPATIPFEAFINGVINETLQVPRVTIKDESRIVFGFGIRDDHCCFVTNTKVDIKTADRDPKDYQYMLDAFGSLETFSIENRPQKSN